MEMYVWLIDERIHEGMPNSRNVGAALQIPEMNVSVSHKTVQIYCP